MAKDPKNPSSSNSGAAVGAAGFKDKPKQRGMSARLRGSKFATFMHSLSFPILRGRISDYAKWNGPPFAGFYKGEYYDGPHTLANDKKLFIYFYSVTTGHQVYFPAQLEQFSDSFSPDWQSEHIYGRGDPIHNYSGTERTIQLSWMLPASDSEEGISNIARANKLITFMYPTATSTGKDEYLAASPLVRVRFSNLIQNANDVGWSPGQGLLCAIDSLSWEPEVDVGFFDGDESRGVSRDVLIPKVLRISVSLTVIHEHFTGWSPSEQRKDPFPSDPYNKASVLSKHKHAQDNYRFGSTHEYDDTSLEDMLHGEHNSSLSYPSIPSRGTGGKHKYGPALDRRLEGIDNKTKRMYDRMNKGTKILGITTNQPGMDAADQAKMKERRQVAEQKKDRAIQRFNTIDESGKWWKY